MKTDPHDPRPFRRWEKRAPNGTMLAVVELEAGTVPVSPDAEGNIYVEVVKG